ncbi:stressosome-associated protein Prli42 [Paenibacillus sp. 481]|nr:stressosome-associated protein Prli42 [Paenibacillus sp. 481]UHA72900.1 stressosome-associated protein Prli42 [Paenibacillus sp. 481]
MQSNRWFKIVVYVMLAAMIGSTLLLLLEPLFYGQ